MKNKLSLSTSAWLISLFLTCFAIHPAIAEDNSKAAKNIEVRQNYTSSQKAETFSNSVSSNSESDLEAKKQTLRKKTLTNYADFADKPLAKPQAKVVIPTKEINLKKVEKVKKSAASSSETTKTKPVSSKSPVLSSLAKIVSQPQKSQVSTTASSAAREVSQEGIKVIKTEKRVVVEETEKVKDVAEKEVTVVKPRPVPKDPSCVNAELEAERARNATTQADKLFYLRRASRLCTSFAGYHIEIGQVYAALGRKEDARFSYNKALELEPNNVEIKELISGLNKQ
ncbi:MAG: tetratricopeptide repeat protein [Deltaproteobacteria bacterium]|jgi:tetratricopeptide (TPR) repeat protein|nr:tetratricopeptide repeat protein [Deltaproteobacteria bacterium]